MARVSRLSIRKRSIANQMQSCSTFDIKFKFDLSIKKRKLIKSEKSMRVSLPLKKVLYNTRIYCFTHGICEKKVKSYFKCFVAILGCVFRRTKIQSTSRRFTSSSNFLHGTCPREAKVRCSQKLFCSNNRGEIQY